VTSPKTCSAPPDPASYQRPARACAPSGLNPGDSDRPETVADLGEVAKSDARTLSWQRVPTHRQASPLLTSNALTWEWAQPGSNQRPSLVKIAPPTCGLANLCRLAESRGERSRAPPSSREQSALPIAPFRPPYVRTHCYVAAHSGTS
jgi:hypothetical protein